MVFVYYKWYIYYNNIVTFIHGRGGHTVYKNRTGSRKYLRPTRLHMQVLIYHMVNAIAACR